MRIHHILDISFHRNGICGAPFHVVLFDDIGDEASRKVGIVFDEPNHVAVLDVAKLADGNIIFGQNSWRGDNYEPELRSATAKHERRIDVFADSSKDGGT